MLRPGYRELLPWWIQAEVDCAAQQLGFGRDCRGVRTSVHATSDIDSQVGRPSVVDPKVLAYATHLRSTGSTMSEIVEATNLSRATLYRHLPTRPSLPAPTVTGTAATR